MTSYVFELALVFLSSRFLHDQIGQDKDFNVLKTKRAL